MKFFENQGYNLFELYSENVVSRWCALNYNLFIPTEDEKSLIMLSFETMDVCRQNWYEKDGKQIFLKENFHQKFEQAIAYSPDRLRKLLMDETWKTGAHYAIDTKIEIVQATVLDAARHLNHPLIMSFANARKPGGGFFFAAKNQEESLCRASTLYASITSEEGQKMYAYNRVSNSAVDTDFMILTPEVAVFRDGEGNFLDEPYYASVITVPAPDRGGKAKRISEQELKQVMKTRLLHFMRVAVLHKYKTLLLGAWGCGAFGNSPYDVAACFQEVLVAENFKKYFDHVVFAIPDYEKFRIFQEQFDRRMSVKQLRVT